MSVTIEWLSTGPPAVRSLGLTSAMWHMSSARLMNWSTFLYTCVVRGGSELFLSSAFLYVFCHVRIWEKS